MLLNDGLNRRALDHSGQVVLQFHIAEHHVADRHDLLDSDGVALVLQEDARDDTVQSDWRGVLLHVIQLLRELERCVGEHSAIELGKTIGI